MRVEVRLPSLGDDEDAVRGGTVSMWLAAPGAAIQEGGDLVELTTDKAAFTVPSPVTGTLIETYVSPGNEVAVGDRLCTIETEAG